MPRDQQEAFETEALCPAEPTKHAGYCRSNGKNHTLFEHYRRLILRDHFERCQSQENAG